MFGLLKNDKRGLTLVEMVISVLILGVVVGAMLGAFMTSRLGMFKAKFYMQAMNLLRYEMEELKNTPYGDISDSKYDTTIDTGSDPDSTADDLIGEVIVEVGDKEDLDGDEDTSEEEINIDNSGGNDLCKPVYVTISWTIPLLGSGNKSESEELVTLISKIGE